jgi:hypothetical protein
MASVVLPAGVVAAWLASLPAYSVSLVVVGPLLLEFALPVIGCARWLHEQIGPSVTTSSPLPMASKSRRYARAALKRRSFA